MARGYKRVASRQWEHTRLLAWITAAASPNREAGKSFPSIEKFLPLPTDAEQLKERQDSIEAQRQRAIDYINKTYGKNLA